MNSYFDEHGNLQTVDKKYLKEEPEAKANDEGIMLGRKDYKDVYYSQASHDETSAQDISKKGSIDNKQREKAASLNANGDSQSKQEKLLNHKAASKENALLGIEAKRKKMGKDIDLRHSVDSINKAMAADPTSGGRNNSVDKVTQEDKNKLITDEEKETLAAMEAYQEQLKEFERRQEEYLVRGAMMHCSCGSHYRRLNLPKCHGIYTSDRPMMNENDSLPGDTFNIPTFGVCNSKSNNTGGSILLKKDVPRNVFGQPTGDVSGNVRGMPCSPIIITTWLCPREKIIVGDGLAITPQSFVVCKYEGIIEVVDSGQFDEQTLPQGKSEKGVMDK
ncbi:MAG: PAAR-like protein [Clostridium sp.]